MEYKASQLGIRKEITDDLDALLETLPPHIADPLRAMEDRHNLLEVVLDLGRVPEARFPSREVVLSNREVDETDIDHIIARIGEFGDDNRAGIERTLHRISAIRNRRGRTVGLTCRVGRAVFGTIGIIRDIVESGKSILLLGRPGVGKTTMLREVARVLADDFRKRVIIVDTSNEIAGDGDIPHPAIGHARRMQVPTPALQHAVMIEAVENHMPETIVIDEIGTELEAAAARTIAERGVQLVATAHGNTLQNLILNPTLSDLIGGIQTVTLGDEEARRRGTQKSVLERKAPPTFDVLVEIQSWDKVAVHQDVAVVVDSILRGQPIPPEQRSLRQDGTIQITRAEDAEGPRASHAHRPATTPKLDLVPSRVVRIYPYGVSQNRLEQAIRDMRVPVATTKDPQNADAVMTLKSYYRKKASPIKDAEASGVPVYVLKNNTVTQMAQCLASIYHLDTNEGTNNVEHALREAEQAISQVLERSTPVDLSPQTAYVRRLQHKMAEKYHLSSRSFGREPNRRVRIFKD
ncbi:MAG: R3H domain-containing nucleic acid-binding protein [Chloroflexota bacterium]